MEYMERSYINHVLILMLVSLVYDGKRFLVRMIKSIGKTHACINFTENFANKDSDLLGFPQNEFNLSS